MGEHVPSGYKQTKVGVIPEDWDVVKLRDIVKVSQGLQIPISSRFNEPSDNRVFYITIPYVEGKKIEYIEDAKKSVLCTKDDLLVVRTGSGAGKIIKDVEGAFHNNFFKLKFLTDLDTNFMYAFLINPRTQFLMNTYAGSSAIPDLNHGDFYALYFLLPPLKEQQKIAKILTTWDDAISQQETLIKAKEELKKGLMQKLLSGEVRFDGFSDEWKEVKLGDVAQIKTGNRDLKDKVDNGEYPFYVRSKNIERISTYSYEGEAILIPGDGQIGQVYHYVNGKFDYHQRVYKISDNISSLLKYLYYVLQQYFHKHAMSFSAKATVDSLRLPIIKSFQIKLPTIEEQQKIVSVLNQSEQEIEFLKNEFEALKEQKHGLMQRLLSGEVRVKV